MSRGAEISLRCISRGDLRSGYKAGWGTGQFLVASSADPGWGRGGIVVLVCAPSVFRRRTRPQCC